MRSAPGVGPSSEKLEPLLPEATRLFVAAGPVTADGYDWYRVFPFEGIAPFGWVAAADHDGTVWLAPDTTPCPTPPLDATALRNLKPFGGVACYGSDEIKLVGDVHCDAVDVDLVYGGPDWLRTDRYCTIGLGGGETMDILDGGVQGLSLPMSGQAVVTGHFDDPQSAACVYAILEPPFPDPQAVVVNCRSMFVASQFAAAP